MARSKTKPQVKMIIEIRPLSPSQEAAGKKLWARLLARAINETAK